MLYSSTNTHGTSSRYHSMILLSSRSGFIDAILAAFTLLYVFSYPPFVTVGIVATLFRIILECSVLFLLGATISNKQTKHFFGAVV